ncbi:hypothetical protein L1987_73912 [Smallanthus sonchifolius]|uniref:Uncharacterized protein n=1 Tax=Smallanthus sonchifolius TaxID=185202 RepID=A0ACB9A1L3_9ASTR|nr:hypothetical protein L1987_73912 [Smallanthus sonchifolius]
MSKHPLNIDHFCFCQGQTSSFCGGRTHFVAVDTRIHFFLNFQCHRFEFNRNRLVQSYICGFMIPTLQMKFQSCL